MNIILLSGGSGKRLWPLSNDIRSKQFIKIFKKKANMWLLLKKYQLTEKHYPCLKNTIRRREDDCSSCTRKSIKSY